MKNLALFERHQALGAKMMAFAGYNMPVSYSSITQEHQAVRERLGVFDVSHMGQFIIRGKDALNVVQYLTSNNAAKLAPGKVQYSCLLNEKGGIVDDLLVYQLQDNGYMLVVNAANIDKDKAWILKHITPEQDVEFLDISSRTTLLAVQGPKAAQALQSLTKVDLVNMTYYTFEKGVFADCENVLISATGYTGAGGFELYFDNKHAEKIWDAVLEAGRDHGILPCGLGARDTLRLEKGYCLYGNDMNEENNPYEAGLGWITKLKKATPSIAQEALMAVKTDGPLKKLIGFELVDKGIARHGYPILEADSGVPIGEVTSGTKSPSLGKAIGMGYVPTAQAIVGSTIKIGVRKKQLEAKIVKTPFL